MRNLLMALALLVGPLAGAQGLITGVVKGQKNEPLAGATISLKDTYDGSTTDSAGNFSFRTSEKGGQVLMVSAIGFKPFE